MDKSVHTREYRVLLELLRELRKSAGLTQAELAERLGQSQSLISKYERGELRLDVVQLRQFCKVTGTTLVAIVKKLEQRLN